MATHADHPNLPERLENLLESDVSTLFLKSDCPPRAKRGDIKNLRLIDIDATPFDNLDLENLEHQLMDLVDSNQHRSDCFLEIDREGCRVIQLGDLRVTSVRPPFGDSREMTIVRPVAKLSLSDYELDQKLIERLSDHHRGVFISGRPGSGKTTLAQAIAEYLDGEIGAMVKTMEAPRDLQLPQRITQYSPLEGDLEKTAEIIFLVRPDFVIFDEVRRARDFEIFSDVRLAGVGLLGVTHANSALEAIQRLIGKVELGLVSQVLDTVIHVEKGSISQVLELRMTVKPPSGMQEELARPVIEIVRFPNGEVTHEMFAFGSEIAVVPVSGSKRRQSPMMEMAGEKLVDYIRDWVGVQSGVKFTSDRSAEIYVPSGMIATVIGKGGENIRALENELGGIKLKVLSINEMPRDVRIEKSKGMSMGDFGFQQDDWKPQKKKRNKKKRR